MRPPKVFALLEVYAIRSEPIVSAPEAAKALESATESVVALTVRSAASVVAVPVPRLT